MRTVFFGTPEFAVPILRALLQHHDVALVVTQPDRAAGRGLGVRASAVAGVAAEHGASVLKPDRVGAAEVIDAVRQSGADAMVVAAYGKILPPHLLSATPVGGINVHASLLPRWRGASPVAAAILAGDTETGVSIMRMDEGMDTGPVLLQRRLPIAPDDTAGTLTARLAELGAAALLDGLAQVEAGTAHFQPQPAAGATHAPRIRKTDGDLRWDLGSDQIERSVRAYNPWPGVRLPIGLQTVRILEGHALPGWAAAGQASQRPGELLATTPQGLEMMAGDGPFLVKVVQAPGKKPMAATDYIRGRRDLAPTSGDGETRPGG